MNKEVTEEELKVYKTVIPEITREKIREAKSHQQRSDSLRKAIRALARRSGKEPREIVDALIAGEILEEWHADVQHIRFWGASK